MARLKPLLLTIDATAALLSVGRTKVYQLIKAGMLPTVPWTGDM
jgi:excisionase family DNA binding protein